MLHRVKGHTFDSPYNNLEAMNRLYHYVRETQEIQSPFANSLIDQNATRNRLSDKQWDWVHFLVAKHEGRFDEGESVQLPNIYRFMYECRQRALHDMSGLQRPKFEIVVDDDNRVALKYLTKGKTPDAIAVTSHLKFDEGQFWGRISKDPPHVFKSRNCPATAIDLLRRIEVDPETVIADLGRATGNCCFCQAPLTDERSIMAGCGPTCAQNYRVWYPTQAECATRRAQEVREQQPASSRRRIRLED